MQEVATMVAKQAKRISVGQIEGKHIAVGPAEVQGECVCCGKVVNTMARNAELNIEEFVCYDNRDCHGTIMKTFKKKFRVNA